MMMPKYTGPWLIACQVANILQRFVDEVGAGSLTPVEIRDIQTYWKSFVSSEDGRVCPV